MKGDEMKNEQKKKKGFLAMLRESFGKSGGCCGGTGCCGPSDEGEKLEANQTQKTKETSQATGK